MRDKIRVGFFHHLDPVNRESTVQKQQERLKPASLLKTDNLTRWLTTAALMKRCSCHTCQTYQPGQQLVNMGMGSLSCA